MKQKYLGKLDLEDKKELDRRLGKGAPTHISLFTGIGGFDIGFANVGIKTKVMVEFDKYCCQTLRANFHWEELKKRTVDGKPEWKNKKEMRKDINWYHTPEPVILEGDIKKITTKEILKAAKLEVGECTVISGGFPCQGFSLSGKRKEGDPRNELYEEFVRIVDEAKPRFFIGENVPGLVSMKRDGVRGAMMQKICEDFAVCGYDIAWDILNAADYGVPQHRKRIFLIGTRIDLMRVREDGSMAIHIGAIPGEIKHPKLFYDRKKRWVAEEKRAKKKR